MSLKIDIYCIKQLDNPITECALDLLNLLHHLNVIELRAGESKILGFSTKTSRSLEDERPDLLRDRGAQWLS